MTITTALGILTGDSATNPQPAGGDLVIGTDGLFQAKLPYQTDYIVKVTSDGFDNFQSHNTGFANAEWNTAAGAQGGAGVQGIPDPTSKVMNVGMSPTVAGTLDSDLKYIIVDAGTKLPIKDAQLVNDTVAAGTTKYTQGSVNSAASFSNSFWGDDSILAGIATLTSDASGVVTIAKGTLKYGYKYSFSVVAAGYAIDSATLGAANSIDPLTIGAANAAITANGQYIMLTKAGSSGAAPAFGMIAASDVVQNAVDAKWSNVAQGSASVTLTYTFNREISVNTNLLLNKTFASQVNLLMNNTNGNTTLIGYTAETTAPTATTMSSYISVTASGSTLTIKLTPTVTTPDTGDDTVFDVNTLFGNILVIDKTASASAGGGQTLKALYANAGAGYLTTVPGGYSNSKAVALAATSVNGGLNIAATLPIVIYNP